MPSRKHIAAGSLFTLILIALGFAVGLWVHSYVTSPAEQQAPPSPKPNTTLYQASAPSKGRVNFTFPVTFTPANKAAFLVVPAAEAGDIKQDQDVLLYDRQKNLLPIIGKVTSVTPDETADTVVLQIRIEDSPDAPAETVAGGDIITDFVKYAQRLPLSALVHHTDESAHVWEVVKGPEGTRLAKLRTIQTPPVTIGDFFILEDGAYTSNVYILNPDDTLQDGQSLKISDVLYQAPPVPNPQSIAEQRAQWDYQLPEKQNPADSAGCSAGCGTAGATNFIDQIKAMAREQAAKKDATP